MDKEIVKEYRKDEYSIVWKPSLCTHSTNCWRGKDGLREVFDPRVKPWIRPEGANAERIKEQVHKCPSGALTIKYHKEEKQ